MSLPNLNLARMHCQRFEFELAAMLEPKDYRLLVKSEILGDFKSKEPNIYVHSYTVGKAKYSALFVCYAQEIKKDKKVALVSQLTYRKGLATIGRGKPTEVKFRKLNDFLSKSAARVDGSVMAFFEFPRKTYRSIIELPYMRSDMKAGKTIKICGLDLVRDEDGEEYRQSIFVDEKSIKMAVYLKHSRVILRSTDIRAKLKQTHELAHELIVAEKGGRNDTK